MLTQRSTVKARLGIDDFNVEFDALLTNAINAVSARFDTEANRTLARTVSTTSEFSADDLEICPRSPRPHRLWPHEGTYEQFSGLDLLPNVETVLKRYTRCTL